VAQPLIYVKEALRLPRADDESANYLRRRNMGINKDQVQGRAEEAKGNVKEAVGKVVGNKDLEVKGNIQKNVGAVQASLGDVKEDVKKVLKSS
jgi:uncharacterized protein YjbJ (UPF0337 family)